MVNLRWWLWVRTTTPPFILFLSTSDPSSIEEHRKIKRGVAPLRVISLLDIGNSPDSGISNELHLDCLRTGNDDDWWQVIMLLIDLAPLVVINVDTTSSGVVKEAEYLILKEFTFKTVYLTKGNACLLQKVGRAVEEADLFITSTHGLNQVILGVLNSRELPSRSHTVDKFTRRSYFIRRFL